MNTYKVYFEGYGVVRANSAEEAEELICDDYEILRSEWQVTGVDEED